MKVIKKLLRTVVTNTPLLSDIYNYYWRFPRTPNSFRGVFQTFSEAEQAVPSHFRLGYNLVESNICDSILPTDLINFSRKSPADLQVDNIHFVAWIHLLSLANIHSSDFVRMTILSYFG
jgi:hypothetical protein